MNDLPPPSPEDKELALAFKRGEKGSYQAIYERHSARVHGVCRRMLPPDDAQEAAQETFLRVYQALNRFNGRYQLGAWITRIATNVCLDHLRASTRRPTAWAPLEELEEKDLPRNARIEEEPESFVIKKAEGRRVLKVLHSLPPLHRAAIVLRDFEGLPYCEIAIALGISEPQVKALLHRARTAFKRSWSATGLAALLPWNLAARFRRPDVALSEHVSAAASSAGQVANVAGSTANAAANCTIALQHCGQAFSERFATAVTALVVGTAAISSGVATSSPQGAVEAYAKDSSHDVPRRLRPKVLGTKTRIAHKKSSPPKDAAEESTSSRPRPAAPAPKPSATPAAVPTAAPASGGGGGGDSGSKPVASPQPTYGPVSPAIGWERGVAISPTAPTENEMTLDCAAKSFTQHLETTIHDGEASYPGVVDVTVGGHMTLDLTVWKYDQEIIYSGGAPQLNVTGSARDTTWTMTGSYSHDGGQDPRGVYLPAYGRFTFRLTLDCLASAIKSEYLGLSSE